MRERRHLVLRKETLTELRAAELAAVGGGSVELPSRGCTGVATFLCETVIRPCSGGCPTYTC